MTHKECFSRVIYVSLQGRNKKASYKFIFGLSGMADK
jgi:hypothetical protein